jgi:hypothetical protein
MSASPVVFLPQATALQEGTLEPLPGGLFALTTAPGVFVSVQPDGRIETRTIVGPWEEASRIAPNLLQYDGAGTTRYIFIQDRQTQPAPGPTPMPTPTFISTPTSNPNHVGAGPLSPDRARQVINATAAEFPQLLRVFGTEDDAVNAATELLRRTIWHLQLAGFQAGRQRNPSGAISADKLTIFIDGGWHVYDVYSLGFAGRATIVQFLEITGADTVQDTGIPD